MKLQCEICGGDIMKKADNDFRCVVCGCIYPLDQLKTKVKPPVENFDHEEPNQENEKKLENCFNEDIRETDCDAVRVKVFQDFEKAGWERIVVERDKISEDVLNLFEYYYYIPATRQYFRVDGDGNYFHGYDLKFEWHTKGTVLSVLKERIRHSSHRGYYDYNSIYERVAALP